MIEKINDFAKEFLEKTDKKKEILIISHFDTDGITSAALFALCLKKLDRKFTFKIIKSLDKEFIEKLPKTGTFVFLDLGSSNILDIALLKNNIFIIDHHEISPGFKLPENIKIVNPHIYGNKEEMSGSCLAYLVAKEILKKPDAEIANLAIIGMVGDILEKNIGPLVNSILKEAEVKTKKGILLYPSTRPLNKTLEYCSNPYIPGITGDRIGSTEILREAGIGFTKNGYKSLIELNEEEMKKLVTAVALRVHDSEKMQDFIGNLFLVKFFNQLEDARELSALINACSRMGHSNIALLMCLGNQKARKHAEKIYIQYKQKIIDALNHVSSNPKIQGKRYVIMNAKDNIQDTIIGTIASILSMSAVYEEGMVIITMAYNQNKIKISTRISGKRKIEEGSRNLKEVMNEITDLLGGESGGHKFAAGCVIDKEQETAFIDLIKKKLDFEVVKI